nr:hypothetical protein [Abalone asfa-like virus]
MEVTPRSVIFPEALYQVDREWGGCVNRLRFLIPQQCSTTRQFVDQFNYNLFGCPLLKNKFSIAEANCGGFYIHNTSDEALHFEFYTKIQQGYFFKDVKHEFTNILLCNKGAVLPVNIAPTLGLSKYKITIDDGTSFIVPTSGKPHNSLVRCVFSSPQPSILVTDNQLDRICKMEGYFSRLNKWMPVNAKNNLIIFRYQDEENQLQDIVFRIKN